MAMLDNQSVRGEVLKEGLGPTVDVRNAAPVDRFW